MIPKLLKNITISDEEVDGIWQRGISYKGRGVIMPILELVNHHYQGQNYEIQETSLSFRGIFSNEILALQLVTNHNIYFMNELMETIRYSINNNLFEEVKKEWLSH